MPLQTQILSIGSVKYSSGDSNSVPTHKKNIMAQENKATDYFKQTIQSYLQRRAQEDELFAPRYANPKKNIDDCITFILNYVKQSGCNGFADDEIYSLAMHYYDEDDIDIGKPLTNCKVVVNHTIVLTEEEKAEARRQAMQKATDEAYRKITQGKNKTKKTETATQSSLF